VRSDRRQDQTQPSHLLLNGVWPLPPRGCDRNRQYLPPGGGRARNAALSSAPSPRATDKPPALAGGSVIVGTCARAVVKGQFAIRFESEISGSMDQGANWQAEESVHSAKVGAKWATCQRVALQASRRPCRNIDATARGNGAPRPGTRDCDEGHGIAGHTSIRIARRALSESMVDRKGDLSIEAGHLAVCGG
jgi:hypothetical protein